MGIESRAEPAVKEIEKTGGRCQQKSKQLVNLVGERLENRAKETDIYFAQLQGQWDTGLRE